VSGALFISDYFGGTDPYLSLYPIIIARYSFLGSDGARWARLTNGNGYLGAAFGPVLGYRQPFTPSYNCNLVPIVLGNSLGPLSGAGKGVPVVGNGLALVGSILSAVGAAQAQKQENLSVAETAICEAQTTFNTYGPQIDALVASGQIDAETGIAAYGQMVAQLIETMLQVAEPSSIGGINWTVASMRCFNDVTQKFYPDLAAQAAAKPASPSPTVQASTTASILPVAAVTAAIASVGISPMLLFALAIGVALLVFLS